jgi:hypothetical protein
MASRPWSPDEVAVLEQHVDQPDWLNKAASKISDRTVQAIKVRMAKLRSELGLGDGRRVEIDDQDVFIATTSLASQQLLAAIQRAGVHP